MGGALSHHVVCPAKYIKILQNNNVCPAKVYYKVGNYAPGARLAQPHAALSGVCTDRSMARVDTKRDVEMVVQKNLHTIFQMHCELSGISIYDISIQFCVGMVKVCLLSSGLLYVSYILVL